MIEQTQIQHEFHEFEVDTRIVNDLIYSQNGTISTALRELVMNAFDANSEKVEVLLWPEGFEVKDTGDGFEDEESILRNFKRFGTPHQEGDALYGRFRIGRGQVMAFAKTTWHSKNFKMITNVKSGDAGFVLQKDAEPYDGCHVFGEFYTPLDSYKVDTAVGDLTSLVRYSPRPVFINQIQVNAQQNVAWDYEDDQVKILFNPKGRYGLHLYSLGILVKELQIYQYGISADVVTKQALKLNMARNEINDEDPLWQHVHSVLRAELRKRQLGKHKLTEAERQALIVQFDCGEIGFVDIADRPLLKDVRGKSTSFLKEMKKRRAWSVCEEHQTRIGDQISTQGNAFVLARAELDIWRVDSVEALIDAAQENMGICTERHSPVPFYRKLLNEIEVTPFDCLSHGVNDQYTLLPMADLTPLEKAQRNALQYTVGNMCKRLEKLHDEPIGKRKVHIGVANAVAWTDSSSFIAVDRKTLSFFDNDTQGLVQLAAILLHELTHRDGSITSNGHDTSFYEAFHDSVISGSVKNDVLGNAIISLRNQYATELDKLNLPFPKWLAEREGKPIVVTLTGHSPTPLLRWFLNLVEFPFTNGRGEIGLQPKGKLWDFPVLLRKRIDAALRKSGLPVVQMDDFSHVANWRDRGKQYLAAKLPHVRALLAKEGFNVSDRCVEILAGHRGVMHGKCPFGGLSALADVEEFGIKCLHQEQLRNVKIMAGKSFIYKSNFRDDWRDRDLTSVDLADGGMEARFAHYKNILTELVDGITDPVEQSEFLSRFFNESMSKSLSRRKDHD